MNETLGKIHFVGSLVCMNVIFMPMFIQGLAGVNRRLWDGGAHLQHAQEPLLLNVPMSYAAFGARLLSAVLHRQPVREHAARPRRRRQPVAGDHARVGARRRRRLRTATSSSRRASIAIRTTTACPGARDRFHAAERSQTAHEPELDGASPTPPTSGPTPG